MFLGTRERKPSPEKKAGITGKMQAQENAEKKSIWKLLIDKIDYNPILRKMQAQELPEPRARKRPFFT